MIAAMTVTTISCWIYKGGKNEDAYVFLSKEDGFDCLPAQLRGALGNLQFVLQLELHEKQPLARANAPDVMKALQTSGYYLQMPPIEAPRPINLQ